MTGVPVVCIVDDDDSVRESLTGLLRSIGYDARPFASAGEFLVGCDPQVAGCAILDVTMPGMSGVDLQEQLITLGYQVPIVFITARTEPALHARLLERGALACLVKPFNEDDLLDAVKVAIDARPRDGEKNQP